MVKLKDNVSMRGIFRMKVFKKGKLIETYEDNNLIVNGAKTAMAALLSGNTAGKSIEQIAFGTNGNVPTPDDTLITGAFAKPLTSVSFPGIGQVEFSWDLLTTEANGKAILEFGLLLGDDTLYARKIRQSPINKDSDIALEGQWLIIF